MAEEQCQSLSTQGVMHISLLSYTHEYNETLLFSCLNILLQVKEASAHGLELNPE